MSELSVSGFGYSHRADPREVARDRRGMYSAEKHLPKMSGTFFAFDEQYLQALVAGDPDTECHFVAYFSGLLRAKLQIRLRSAQDVEDLRQEVFLRVLQSLRSGPGLQHPGKLGAFVHAVCNNVVFEYLRSRSRMEQWDDTTPEPRDQGSGTEHALLSEEAREQVRSVLNELPSRDRGLLRAVFLEEREKDAVCREYGVQREYLRVLLHRARRRLRDVLTAANPSARAAVQRHGGAQ